jgi:hypothetical protein
MITVLCPRRELYSQTKMIGGYQAPFLMGYSLIFTLVDVRRAGRRADSSTALSWGSRSLHPPLLTVVTPCALIPRFRRHRFTSPVARTTRLTNHC